MNKRRIIVQGLCSVLAVIGVAYGRLISFPDAVSRLYGLPITWGVHQLVTIAGPVDVWSINITNLAIDLIFWLITILVLPSILEGKTGNQ